MNEKINPMLTDPFEKIVLNLPGWGNMHMIVQRLPKQISNLQKKNKALMISQFLSAANGAASQSSNDTKYIGSLKVTEHRFLFLLKKTLCFLVDLPHRWTTLHIDPPLRGV